MNESAKVFRFFKSLKNDYWEIILKTIGTNPPFHEQTTLPSFLAEETLLSLSITPLQTISQVILYLNRI